MAGLTLSPRFSARFLADHLTVVDSARHELHVLNPSAAALWLSLDDEPQDLRGLSGSLGRLFGRAPDEMESDIAATIDEWSARGWLESGDSRYRLTHEKARESDIFHERAKSYPPESALPPHEIVSDLRISLGDDFCRVLLCRTGEEGFPDAIPRLEALLSGLAASGERPFSTELCLVNAGHGFWLKRADGVLWTTDESFALSSLTSGILDHLYADAGLFATVHAAALCREGGAVLLPGMSGFGKSTLAAYLAFRGWGYLGDDIVALGRRVEDEHDLILPFPTALGIKPSSWPMVAAWYPELDAYPVVSYADRQARFLRILHDGIDDPRRRRVRAIVFPRYCAGQPAELTPIDPVQAICSLVEAGFTTGGLLQAQRVERLLDLLERVRGYRLTYSRLEDAERHLRELTA